jgi:hypothetical protein
MVPSAGYMASLAQKLNQFIVKDYFDKLKELLMRFDIIDKTERIYIVDEEGCKLSFLFFSKDLGLYFKLKIRILFLLLSG